MSRATKVQPSGTARVALWISIGSGIASLVTVFFTIKNYQITHRAVDGVIEVRPHPLMVEGKPAVVAWQINIKNVGSVPATIRKATNTVQLTERNEIRYGNGYGEPNKSIFILPGAFSQVGGSI